MDHYNALQNNDDFTNNLQPLQMDQPLSNTLNNSVNSSCDYSDFSITSNNIIPTSYTTANDYEQQQQQQQQQQSIFSSVNNENHTTTTYEPQYTNHTNHISSPSPFNSLNMVTNSFQINHSDVFKFEIPGFKIVIIPTFSTTSSYTNLNNFDEQNQFQQGYTSTVDVHNSQTQFNNF
jgi:hypothetical protein